MKTGFFVLFVLLIGCVDRPYRIERIDPDKGKEENNWKVKGEVRVAAGKGYCKQRKEQGEEYKPAATIEQKKDKEGNDTYWLGFIEVDDQGYIWSPNQEEYVFSKLENYIQGNEVILVTFVHGFRNNASVCNTKVEEFRRLLSRLAAKEKEAVRGTETKPRKVCGVYLGWRGSLRKGESSVGFGGRKRSSHRVGEGAAFRILNRLANLNGSFRAQSDSHSRSVIIGHSLGGAVLMSAIHSRYEWILSQWSAPSTTVQQETVIPFADLVLLINPAFEALRFQELYRLSRQAETYNGPPLLVSISTQKDKVNKRLFRFAMKHWYKHGGFRNEKQEKAFQTAFGQYSPYWTHKISKVALESCTSKYAVLMNPADTKKKAPTAEEKQERIAEQYTFVPEGTESDEARAAVAQTVEEIRSGSQKCINFKKIIDIRKPTEPPRFTGPYLSFADLDGSLMTKHNPDPNSLVLLSFIDELFVNLRVVDPRVESATVQVMKKLSKIPHAMPHLKQIIPEQKTSIETPVEPRAKIPTKSSEEEGTDQGE